MSELDSSQFDHFKEIPCDKCGSTASYSPDVIDDVVECFGCECKRLEETEINCKCGWKGNHFDLALDGLNHKFCPVCGKEQTNE